MNKFSKIILAGLLIISLAGLSGLGSGLAAIVTPTPTTTPTPTRATLISSLRSQLFYAGLGGPPAADCSPALLKQVKHLPALFYTNWHEERSRFPTNPPNLVSLCIFGLATKKGISLEVYRPDGELAGQGSYQVGRPFPSESFTNSFELLQIGSDENRLGGIIGEVDGVPVISLDLWLPSGIPAGEWRARVSVPGASVEDTFKVPPSPYQPLVSIDKPPAYLFPFADPLVAPSGSYGDSNAGDCLPVGSGDLVILFGVNFSPNSSTPLGVYTDLGDYQFTLVDQRIARAGRTGVWVAFRNIKAVDQPGVYWWIAVVDPTGEEISSVGPGMCFEISSWQPCPNAERSSLAVGDQVQVKKLPASLDRLRVKPNRDTQAGAGLKTGDPLKIIGGPVCQGKWVWWQLSTEAGDQGWFPEREKFDIWLEKNDHG